MESVIKQIEAKQKKSQVVDVRSGDSVRVHQKIKEGKKERVQVFQGLVIRTDRKGSQTSRITVRRISSGVGVEKAFMLHSPLVVKVEVTKRSKVRRNYLSYMRERTGKSARMTGMNFDKDAVNTVQDDSAEVVEKLTKEEATKQHEAEAALKAEEEAKEEAKVAEALQAHEAAAKEAKSE